MKELKVKPIGDRVIVEADKVEEKTASGIYIPDSSKDKPNRGVVVATGTDLLGLGDRVLFSKHSGTEINIEGDIYVILNHLDILAVV